MRAQIQVEISGQAVSLKRRLFGDYLLEIALMFLTLFVGWLIWFAIVSRRGTTPAKQLVGVYIHDAATGAIASAPKVWLRDVAGKLLLARVLATVLGAMTGWSSVYYSLEFFDVAAGIFILANKDHHAVWDTIAGTTVRYHPPVPRTTLDDYNESAAYD